MEDAARERQVTASELSEGGSPRVYGEMMGVLDAGIGRVLDAVRRADAASGRSTPAVFTSDNGGERYSKIWPFIGREWDLLEGGLRVPQTACWPGRIPPGQVTDQLSIRMDLTAACLAAAGVPPHPDHPLGGMDLLPVLEGSASAAERELFWRMANRAQRAVWRVGWKYLKVEDREFLFDIAYDPRERGDGSRKHPERLAELRALCEEWAADMHPIPADTTPPLMNLSEALW